MEELYEKTIPIWKRVKEATSCSIEQAQSASAAIMLIIAAKGAAQSLHKEVKDYIANQMIDVGVATLDGDSQHD